MTRWIVDGDPKLGLLIGFRQINKFFIFNVFITNHLNSFHWLIFLIERDYGWVKKPHLNKTDFPERQGRINGKLLIPISWGNLKDTTHNSSIDATNPLRCTKFGIYRCTQCNAIPSWSSLRSCAVVVQYLMKPETFDLLSLTLSVRC